MTKVILLIVTTILWSSCGQKRSQINHNAVDTTSMVEDRFDDTTKILIAELPVRFDSTDILLFAIILLTWTRERDTANLVLNLKAPKRQLILIAKS